MSVPFDAGGDYIRCENQEVRITGGHFGGQLLQIPMWLCSLVSGVFPLVSVSLPQSANSNINSLIRKYLRTQRQCNRHLHVRMKHCLCFLKSISACTELPLGPLCLYNGKIHRKFSSNIYIKEWKKKKESVFSPHEPEVWFCAVTYTISSLQKYTSILIIKKNHAVNF